MDRARNRWIGYGLAVAMFAAIMVPSTGCSALQLVGVLTHAWHGEKVAAQYDGLQNQRVAIVCLSDSSMYAGQLSQAVQRLLAKNVSDIETVPQTEVYAWLDKNDWNELDFVQLGQGVDADSVVSIELDSFRLYDGMTMYNGHADVSIRVYDVASDGEVVFRSDPFEFTFPKSAPLASTDMSESQFRRMFMNALARRIAKTFYTYDVNDDFAADNTLGR